MSLYDPSLVLAVEERSDAPFGAFEPGAAEHQRELIEEPVRNGASALHHPRAEARRQLAKLMHNALVRLLGRYHVTVSGGAHPSNARAPAPEEAAVARARFAQEPALHGLAFDVVRLRGYELHLDRLDKRDGFTTRQPRAEGNSYPGMSSELPARSAQPFGFHIAGVR